MRKPEWFIFDVGGVLLDWQRSSADLAQKLGVDRGFLLKTLFEFAPSMNTGQISPEAGWKKILNAMSKDGDPSEIIRFWRSKKYWYKDTLRLVQGLNRSGYKLAIFTNSWLGLLEERDKNDLPSEIGLFNIIFDSAVEGIRKPDIYFYDLVERKIGALGQDILFIDDDINNLDTARKKNWQIFLFEPINGSTAQSVATLKKKLNL